MALCKKSFCSIENGNCFLEESNDLLFVWRCILRVQAQFVYFEFQRKKISELVSKSSIIVILNPLAYKSVKVFSIIRRLYFTSQLHKIFTPTIDINNFHNVLRANEEFI